LFEDLVESLAIAVLSVDEVVEDFDPDVARLSEDFVVVDEADFV
jgi:hypothetical protein